MAAILDIKINGLDQLLATLKDVELAVKTKIVRRAMRHAGQIVLNAARSRVPTETGLLKQSLAIKYKYYPTSATAVAIVGPRTKFRRMVQRSSRVVKKYRILSNPSNYAHLVEFGTRPHALGRGSDRVRRSGRNGPQRGRMHPGAVAKPFIGPALASSRSAAIQAMTTELAKNIIQEVSQ